MSVDEKKFALVLELNGSMLNNSNMAMTRLADQLSINHIFSRSPCPHVVIDAGFDVNNLDGFRVVLESGLGKALNFSITGRGLGVFVVNTPVVHIRWCIDESFNEFRCHVSACLETAQNEGIISGYSRDLNWVPKTTLAYIDTSYKNLSSILEVIKDIQFGLDMDVVSISLYEYSDLEGETRLYTLPLNI